MDERGLLDFIILEIPGISLRDRLFLCEKFDREGEISIFSKGDIEKILSRSLAHHAFTLPGLLKQAEAGYRRAVKQGMGFVSCRSAAYPPLLRKIADPPVLLFYRGRLPSPERPPAAVVGTRKPSGAGARAAYELARDLGGAGIPVVSGLALGIDAMAHRGAVDSGLGGLAVLGSGLDMVYPASNRPLAGKILEAGGALVSEYLPGTKPRRWHFPARNRIISGLCRGTVMVEGPEHSGALITARFARDQGRELWVSGAGMRSPRGEGTRRLAASGAAVLESAAELLARWGLEPEKSPAKEGSVPEKELSTGESLALSFMKELLHGGGGPGA